MQKGRVSVFSKASRAIVPFMLVGALAGCNSSSTLSDAAPSTGPTGAAAPLVVQATCPQVLLRDGTAFHRVYAGGAAGSADGDPDKLIYQASFAEMTRSCTTNGENLTINVMAQGRILAGPAGKGGPVTLPVRVTVMETTSMQEQQSIYDQHVRFPVEIPADTLSGQFLFTKADVTIPVSSARNATVFIGFEDAAPAKSTGKGKRK